MAWNRDGSEPLEHCTTCVPNEVCGGVMTRKALLKQRIDGEMDRVLCGKRDCGGKKASCRLIDSNETGAG